MTKPAIAPTWATDATFGSGPRPGDPNKIDPGAGKRAAGWIPREKPTPETWNHHSNLQGQWHEYHEDKRTLALASSMQAFDTDSLVASPAPHISVDYSPVGSGAGNGRWGIAAVSTVPGGTSIYYADRLDGPYTPVVVAGGVQTSCTHSKGLLYSQLTGEWILSSQADPTNTFGIWTSPDLVTWTGRATHLATTGSHSGLAESPSIIVATGNSGAGQIYTSFDAFTWTVRANPAASALTSVAWSPTLGLFAAVGGGFGAIVTSPDGITWTNRSVGSVAFSDIVWDPYSGRFVATRAGGGGVTYSTDGVTWTSTGVVLSVPGSGQLTGPSIATDGEGTLIATGQCVVLTDVLGCCVSRDGGDTWQCFQLDPGRRFKAVTASLPFSGIRFVDGRFIQTGEGWQESAATFKGAIARTNRVSV